MYSLRVQAFLEEAGVKIGDFVAVSGKEFSCEGVLMPRIELGDADCLVLKLENGYNSGVRFEKNLKIEKIKAKPAVQFGERQSLPLCFDKSKPKVSLVVTGGTIGSRIEYKTGGVIALMNPNELLHVAPELADFVNLQDILRPFNRMSEDMTSADWQELAKTAAKELNSDNAGVIITHGTDTLHYTAAALSFMLRGLSKPVVITGSQRSSDRGSSDAAMNLVCSSYVAGYSDFAEVGVCMHATSNDDYCFFLRGTTCRKMHSSRRDAFRPVNDFPLAKVWPQGKIEVLNADHRKRCEEKVTPATKFEDKVALLKTYPGASPAVLEFLLGEGYKGFVLEGTGLGHVPTWSENSWIPSIKKAVDSGVVVAVASQAFYGKINTRVYSNLRTLFHEAGAVPADMLPETAFVKLGWLLGNSRDLDDVKRLMTVNVAGEIPQRVTHDEFLY